MREHINLFESQDEIERFCIKNNIHYYEITPDGVDVDQYTRIKYTTKKLPFQFNIVHGDFDCENCNLKSLQNTPRVVHGDFSCSYNKFQSLQFCPKFIKGDFDCNSNPIEPWEHRYLLFSEIQGKIYTGNTELDLFFKRYQNKKAGIPQALKELRELQIQRDQKNA